MILNHLIMLIAACIACVVANCKFVKGEFFMSGFVEDKLVCTKFDSCELERDKLFSDTIFSLVLLIKNTYIIIITKNIVKIYKFFIYI